MLDMLRQNLIIRNVEKVTFTQKNRGILNVCPYALGGIYEE